MILKPDSFGQMFVMDVTVSASDWLARLLKSLDVWRAKSLTNVGLKALGSGCVYLEELDAGWW